MVAIEELGWCILAALLTSSLAVMYLMICRRKTKTLYSLYIGSLSVLVSVSADALMLIILSYIYIACA